MAKEEKQAKEAKYTFALVDGKQEQVMTLLTTLHISIAARAPMLATLAVMHMG